MQFSGTSNHSMQFLTLLGGEIRWVTSRACGRETTAKFNRQGVWLPTFVLYISSVCGALPLHHKSWRCQKHRSWRLCMRWRRNWRPCQIFQTWPHGRRYEVSFAAVQPKTLYDGTWERFRIECYILQLRIGSSRSMAFSLKIVNNGPLVIWQGY